MSADMHGGRLLVCTVVVIVHLITSARWSIGAEASYVRNGTRVLDILPGVKFLLADGEMSVHVRINDLLLLDTTVAEARKKEGNPLQRLGMMVMMTPFVMQVLSLPGALASIKMSLLKSIMVAQLAIAIMIYNLIRSAQNSDVVVVHQPHHRQHYHHNRPPNDDDEDSWFGR